MEHVIIIIIMIIIIAIIIVITMSVCMFKGVERVACS